MASDQPSSDVSLPEPSRTPPSVWSVSPSLEHIRQELDEQAAIIAEAKRLLEESGWVDSDGDGIREKNGEKLTVDWPDNPAWSEAFNELLIGYLAETGIDVQYRSMDDNAAYNELLAGNYSLVYMYWTRPDPSPLRYLFHSEGINGAGSAWTNYSNADLDAALADADTNTDEAARKADYVKAQDIIMENALDLPMFTVNTSYLIAPSVQGFGFDLEGYPWIYDISLAQ